MPSAKLDSSESIAPFAGWLPPLVDSSDQTSGRNNRPSCWWFPVRTDSVASLVGILHQPDPRGLAADRLGACLRSDPGLLVYTAAQWVSSQCASSQSIAPEICRPEDLVRWWCDHGIARLSDDDVLRPDPTALWPRMQQLDQYFRTLPRSRWLAQASIWFDVSGEPLGPPWRNTLSSLRWEDDGTSEPNDQSSLRQTLNLVARRLQATKAMESQWTDRVQQNRLQLAKNLAYGLSHEINNPLAAIVTRAESILHQDPNGEIESGLKRIIQQSFRAHAMIADLMFFAHPTSPQRARFGLNGKIREVLLPLCEEFTRLQIDVHVDVDQAIQLHADPDMIGDAILAVLSNAIDAVGTQGRIDVTATNHNNECCITIADSGPGVSAEDARRAFDPYFSGREAGRGLGLGLCRVHRIVQLHGGKARLIAATVGCTIRLQLPLHREV